jgi:sugar/nucleoside kinase (ribokinase family)
MSKRARKPAPAPEPAPVVAPVKEHTPDGIDPQDFLPHPNPRRKFFTSRAEELAHNGVALERAVRVNDAHAEAVKLAAKHGVEVRVSFSTAAPMARLVLVP